MSKTVVINSANQFSSLLESSSVVVADFHATWCGPCKQIAPIYEQLSQQLSRPNKVTFAKIDVDQQKDIATNYEITAMPTFLIFKGGREVRRIRGANAAQIQDAIKKLAAEADSASSSSGGGFGESSGTKYWLGAGLAKGYGDVTGEVDTKGLDLLNADPSKSPAATLFDAKQPSSLGPTPGKDWVESDTDEQLMLFVPFQSSLKLHSIHLTAIPSGDAMRPRTVHLYTNRSHNMGFDEADDVPPTQTLALEAKDWDAATATARCDLRFVKFQNVTSVVVFVVDGEGDGDRCRLDRVRFVGDVGGRRDLGKLEKVGEES